MQTFNNFSELAKAMGIKTKAKAKKQEVVKCKVCGSPMVQKTGTNVYVCNSCKMEDKTLKNGTTVQVFTSCDTFQLV